MQATIQLSPGGRIVIPARMRQALRLEDGARLVASWVEGTREVTLVPVDEVLDALQAEAAVLLGGHPGLAAELCAERRAEAEP